MVVLIGLTSRSNSYWLAGLIPLFPTFALISNYIVGTDRGAADLKTTVLFGMFSLIPYFFYLGAVYLTAGRMPVLLALSSGVVLWIGAAALLIHLWNSAT